MIRTCTIDRPLVEWLLWNTPSKNDRSIWMFDLECGFKQSEIILFIVSNFVQNAGIFYKTKFSSRVALVASIGDTSAAWRLHTRVSGGGFMQLGWGGLGGGCFGGLLERNTSTQLCCSVARQTSHKTFAKLSKNKPKWSFIFQYDQPLQVDSFLTHLESMP